MDYSAKQDYLSGSRNYQAYSPGQSTLYSAKAPESQAGSCCGRKCPGCTRWMNKR